MNVQYLAHDRYYKTNEWINEQLTFELGDISMFIELLEECSDIWFGQQKCQILFMVQLSKYLKIQGDHILYPFRILASHGCDIKIQLDLGRSNPNGP